MRISDWSSDVCSSDLPLRPIAAQRPPLEGTAQIVRERPALAHGEDAGLRPRVRHHRGDVARREEVAIGDRAQGDRKCCVEGKGVSVSVATGGGRSTKKKQTERQSVMIKCRVGE